jgi:hypothetical protein
MKSNHLCWLTPLACLGILAVSESANATVVWTSGFEKGDLSEWTPGVNATKTLAGGMVRQNVVVQQAQVYTGKYACEITVHPDDLFGQYVQDRVDIQHQSTLTAEGKDTWVSGHYLMLADAGMRNEFAFWESNVSSTNVIDFWVEPKGEGGTGTTVNFGVGFLGATQLWSADFVIGKWHQVAIHVHWSTNPKLGGVDVWFDGKQVVTAYAFQTKPDANTLFYQNGLHRKSPPPAGMNIVDTIYIDDFIEADTFAEAQIAAPIDSESDGGTGVATEPEGGAVDASGVEASASTPGSSAGGGASGANDEDASGPTSTAGSSGASGASSPGGSGGAGGSARTSATASGEATSSGALTDQVDSSSKSGCAVSGYHSRVMPLASGLALTAFVLAGRRRARARGGELRSPIPPRNRRGAR